VGSSRGGSPPASATRVGDKSRKYVYWHSCDRTDKYQYQSAAVPKAFGCTDTLSFPGGERIVPPGLQLQSDLHTPREPLHGEVSDFPAYFSMKEADPWGHYKSWGAGPRASTTDVDVISVPSAKVTGNYRHSYFLSN